MKSLSLALVSLLYISAISADNVFPIFANILPGENVEMVDTSKLNEGLPVFTDLKPDEEVDIVDTSKLNEGFPVFTDLKPDEEVDIVDTSKLKEGLPIFTDLKPNEQVDIVDTSKLQEAENPNQSKSTAVACDACFERILELINAIQQNL
ncbi:hypothetical protein GWI33_010578 [Rhynchophorus ferrugineus]|uniref:Uncharacterized protein n=1 Tax=Rhynchophorus ferrugineus TaxID=354439 RepID=A0A834MM87_RHYFE|nr:hypothetical protein GWI33_010578 [Rhynchophorus ferrugineus]